MSQVIVVNNSLKIANNLCDILEQRDIIEDVIEPYLMQKGLVQRTSRGRILSKKGFNHLK